MGKTGAERNREYRARMCDEKKKIEREKNKQQQQISRSQWSAKRKKEEAEKSKLRMKKYRLNKAADSKATNKTSGQDQETPSKIYTTPQALGKAVKRVKKTLPFCPRKQKAVIMKLSREMKITTTENTTTKEKDWSLVHDYYTSDLVSRIMPGKKDYITVKCQNGKETFQKRVMIMSVMEAFQVFKKEYPEYKIQKSKFAALRPLYVVPVSEKDHTVCCCKYHENFNLLLQGFKKFLPQMPLSDDEIMQGAVCNWEYKCCFGECPDCAHVEDYVDGIFVEVQVDDDKPGEYWRWTQNNKKELIMRTYLEMKEELLDQLKFMLKHTFTAKTQLREIKHLKSILGNEEVALHVDFSENFVMKQQDEIMSAHWLSEGVTLYTAVINANNKVTSYVVVSDDLTHDKCAVFCFNKAILQNYTTQSTLSILHVFSDGAGSQFKNRFTMSTLLEPEKICTSLKYIDWNFFGTAHGKGAVDGVGGTVKRAVWRRILQRKIVVNTAKDFAVAATNACPNITILYVPSSDTSTAREKLLRYWEEEMKPNNIPNTHQVHYAVPKNRTTLIVSNLSPYLEDISIETREIVVYNTTPEPASSSSSSPILEATAPVQESHDLESNSPVPSASGSSHHLSVLGKNDFVIVEYDGRRYPGIIEEVGAANESFLIDVMHCCLGGWKWPQQRDMIWYTKDKVLKKITHPDPVNDRGVFMFNDDI